MRIRLLILILILLLPVVFSSVESSRVFVVNFNYDNGIVTYKDRVEKWGYAPDRRIQPEEGYTAEVLSIDNEVLHSLRFDIPLKLNVDISNSDGNLSGGIIVLNETDFALILPYYGRAKSIIIYNPRDYEILTVPLIEEQFFIKEKSFWWVGLLVVVALIAIYVIYRGHKNKQS